jgi:hypothetical protein
MLAMERARNHTEDMARVKRNDVAVKLDADVARLARIVAAERGQPIAAYISDILRPIVERDAAEVGAKLVKKPEPTGKPKGGAK